jgi:hypothetical protein
MEHTRIRPFPPPSPYRRLTLYALAGLGVFTLSGAVPAPGWGQGMACLPRDQIVAQLLKDYNESPVEFGIVTGGQAVLERFATPNGETWTMMLTRPDGLSCFLRAGEQWQEHPKAEKPGDGA